MGPRRRGRAALIGLAIGGAAGAIVGATGGSDCSGQAFCIDPIGPGAAAAVLGVVGGGIGAGIGAAVAQPHREVLYRAP